MTVTRESPLSIHCHGLDLSRLCLGCAQLGMDYGVANRTGGVSEQEAYELLRCGIEAGVNCLDTAHAYGESEKRIGGFLKQSGFSLKIHITTKINPDAANPTAWQASLDNSLNNLGVSQIFCLLAHRSALLRDPAWELFIRKNKESGKIIFSGVSTYTPHEFEAASAQGYVDVIQAPVNAFDDRLILSGLLKQAQACKKLVFFRSIFLQGALLLDAGALPERLLFARSWIAEWNALVHGSGFSAQELLFRYVWHKFPEAIIIFGAETKSQIQENVALSRSGGGISQSLFQAMEILRKKIPLQLLNPSEWRGA